MAVLSILSSMPVFSNEFVYLNYSGSVKGDNTVTCTALITPKFKPDIKVLAAEEVSHSKTWILSFPCFHVL